MTIGGWILFLASLTSVSALFLWCVAKILTVPQEAEHVHGLEVNPEGEERE